MKERINKAFHASSFRYGTFSLIITAVVLAIVIAVNLVVSQLPTEITSIDISDNQLYSIGDTTKEFVSTVTDDVTIYIIATDGSEDETTVQLLEKYKDLSDHITVTTVDPDTNPTFLTNHDISTDDLSGYTDLLVVSEKREKFIGYWDIYDISYTSYYSYDVYYDAEGQVTSAISYVTTDEIPKMYVLSGHNEEEFSTTVTSLIEQNNIEIESWNILTDGDIPDDCDILAIVKPTSDFTEDEVDVLENYIAYGGNCVIINYADCQANMPNYCDFLAYYGVEIGTGGYIFEASGYCIEQARWYLYEPLTSSHDITSDFSSNNAVLVSYTQPIYQLEDMRNTLTIEAFLTTSDGSWLRTDLESTLYDEKIDSDVDGPFDIAVTITDQTNEGEGKIVLFSTYDLLSDNYVGTSYGYSNGDLFISALDYLCSLQTSINISSKSASISYNTTTSAQLQFSLLLFEITIPLVILIGGFVVWFRRRRR